MFTIITLSKNIYIFLKILCRRDSVSIIKQKRRDSSYIKGRKEHLVTKEPLAETLFIKNSS